MFSYLILIAYTLPLCGVALDLSRIFGIILRGNSPETLLSSVNSVELRQGICIKAFHFKHYSMRIHAIRSVPSELQPRDTSYGLELIKAWGEAGASVHASPSLSQGS